VTERSSKAPALAFGIPAILILALLPFVHVEDGASLPKLFLFLGRFHPSLLHLPVAFLLLALLLEVMRVPALRRFVPDLPETVLDLVLGLAAGGGFVTALAGWLLAQEGGYDADLLERHLWGGVVTGIGAIACVVVRSLARAQPERAAPRTVATGLLAGTCLVMALAAHAGGSLTHGGDYLTEHAPAFVRRMMGLHVPRDRSREPLTTIAERQAFDGVALRILEDHCTSCHNPGKIKGQLRLDTYEGVLEGGQSGPVVLAGDAGASAVLQRVHLPLDEEKHMPPKGMEQLTDDEILVLTWWIEAGLPNTETLRQLKAPPEIRVAFSRSLPERERRAVEELQSRLAVEYEATLADLRAAIPGSLRPITPGERDLEYTAAIAGTDFGDLELERLGAAGKDMVWLDLSRTGVSDQGLKVLAEMPNLEHLDLRGTSVGDEGLRALAGLDRLETLGLYGTQVTDAGLVAIEALPSLRRLHLGGTAVTEAGREGLRETRGELQLTP
jgi:uncharacterized membrane protein